MRNREAGFTLGEVLVVLVMGAAACAAGFSVLVHAHDDSRRAQDAARVVQVATRTLATLEGDLRRASVVEEADDDLLRCSGPDGAFTWKVVRGTLVRDDARGRVPFLDGVWSMGVHARGRLVEVTLRYAPRYGGGTPPPLHTVVALRAGGGGR